jgi:hypothetical protein
VHRPSRPATPSTPSTQAAGATNNAAVPAGNHDAIGTATQYLGWNARDLKVSGNAVGKAMQDWVPNNINCANFVSGVLVASGQIPQREANASVTGLQGNLDRDPHFSRVSLANAKPGDVVSMRTSGGGHHVVMFAGWKNGRPLFIGSNNINPDGTQRISYSQARYPIMSIHHYNG